MKVRKTIKKIMALGAGVAMVGATLLGATASADLGNYPDMFIKDGKFDGYMVVGDSAVSMDVVGITNIAASMQADAVKTTYVSVGQAATTSVDEGVKIDKTSDHLTLGVDLENIQTTALDNNDAPVMLADGNYDESEGNTDNNEDYTQEIAFTNAAGIVQFAQDDNDAPVGGWYLYFDDGSSKYTYTYTLEFDNPIEIDTTSSTTESNDLEGTELEMQGNTYTIVDASFTNNALDKLSLMAGETVIWLAEGESVTRVIDGTEHEIQMLDVTNGEDACGFKVDGSTVWVDVDKTETKNGVTIGVLDAKAVYTEKYNKDICKINVGASELVLEDGKEVKVNGKDVRGSDVEINASAASGWSKLTITYVPDDNTYLAPGDTLLDPVLGNFKFVVGNVVQKTEDVTFTASGDDATLTFMNNDGREVEIPFYQTVAGWMRPADGDGINDMVYLEGERCNATSNDVRDCENSKFLAITSGNEAHVVEIRDIDTTNHQIDFRDLTYGADDNDNDYTPGTLTTIGLGSGVGNIALNITHAGGVVIFNDTFLGGANYMETELEARLWLNRSDNDTVVFDEKGGDNNVVEDSTSIWFRYDTGTDDRAEFSVPAFGAGYDAIDFSDANSDDKYAVSLWGTVAAYDNENDQSIVLTYPEEPAYLEVFFSPVSATVLEGDSAGDVATQTVQKIAVGAVKLASEVSNVKNVNAIVVGGPCANTAAAELLGNPANCAEGFEEGHAMVKLFENNGKVQMLVAGYAAEDTRRAALVVAEYDKYDSLSGDEVDITGTSLTDIAVSEPSVMEQPVVEDNTTTTTE